MKRLLFIFLTSFVCVTLSAQIKNLLGVDDAVFQRYAYGRMQQYNEANLALADSLYVLGVEQGSYRIQSLGLSLEMSPRFARKEYGRMDEIASQLKSLLDGKAGAGDFYFSAMYDYCQFLIFADRGTDAMLEARSMERKASEVCNALGLMYAYRVLGLIQMYRSNSTYAISNFEKSAEFCEKASYEQELPNLYILIAQECVKLGKFEEAEDYCRRAEEYQDFFPSLRPKLLMTKAYLYDSKGDVALFRECYDELVGDALYEHQVDADARTTMDICDLRSRSLFEEALAKADSLGTERARHEQKHPVYADLGDYRNAYLQVMDLMRVKDSIYVAVQNEDMAILDAEMNNARLRQEADRLEARNQTTLLIGLMLLIGIAFSAIILSQWLLRRNLEALRTRNREALLVREAYRKALDSKEQENAIKVRLIQNRKNNTYRI